MKKENFTQGMKAVVVLFTMLCGTVGAWAGNPSVKYVSRTWNEKNNKLIEKTLYVDDYIVLVIK